MEYKVTLTQKVKIEVEAETPQSALEQAKAQATADNRIFEPDTFSVKEQ